LVLLLAIPAASSGNSLEPASPEVRPRPSIWFALESTLPSLPPAALHFGVSTPAEDLLAYAGDLSPDVLRTGYQTEEDADIRAAAARALRAVTPPPDELP
jgi:hypothetical protein